MAKEHKPDIICIQESKLQPKQEAPNIPHYSSETVSRDRTGGGVVTYIKEEIKWQMIDYEDNAGCISLIENKLGILDLLTLETQEEFVFRKFLLYQG